MFTLLRIVKWFLRKKYGCDSIAFYFNNTIVLKCTRSFSHHDFSFSLAYLVVSGIQSTPSSPLDGSTSAVVPSTILNSTSESKFLSFPLLWMYCEFDEHSFVPFLWTLTSAILQFSVILKNWNRSRSLQYKYTATVSSLWRILKENFSLCTFPPCAARFFDFFSATLWDISTPCTSTYSLY